MQFPQTIISDGQSFTLVSTYRDRYGWLKADYYNANGIMSQWITISGGFVSESL